MYISEIKIKNFRNFEEETVRFNPGLNILIGHNNTGKTNLLSALQLVFDRNTNNKPTIDDFCKKLKDFSSPPSIEVSVLLKEHNDEPDDYTVVFDWVIQTPPDYIAKLNYIYELPTKHHSEYNKLIADFKGEDESYDTESCLKEIEKKFLPKYISRIYGGDPSKKEKASVEELERFDFQFLTAIRDAEREMFFGNNTILKDVLNYFLDYDITKGQDIDDLSDVQSTTIKERERDFKSKSKVVLENLIKRIDKDQILQYSKETGADKGGIPSFDADASEQELLFALRLIVEKSGLKIPINNNGLGYNNLLYIALILAKMQMEVSSAFMGDNAKVFPIMAIEEPEAHLHPSLQAKFLKFLESNLETKTQARQVFVTSHSTHITSAVELDSVICLYTDIESKLRIGYPGRAFSESNEDQNSKIYVERFLDATKSDMLFAERIIFVEGLSEQMLIPCFAEYLDLEQTLVNNHTAIISVDSRTFKHFLKIFSFDEEENPFAIKKKVVCITDADPTAKKGKYWVSKFPFSLEHEESTKPLSTHVQDLKSIFADKNENIFVFHPNEETGKTLEYELAQYNPKSELLITDSFPSQNSAHTPDNFKMLQDMIENDTDDLIEKYKELRGINEIGDDDILAGISTSSWSNEKKNKAFLAAVYYTIVQNAKGEHAFFLEKKLRDNFNSGDDKYQFSIPEYIRKALEEITV